jgi:hypothetical protein
MPGLTGASALAPKTTSADSGDATLIPTLPVNNGDARAAFKFKAFCVAVLMGFSKSVVLLTFANPTVVAVIPETVPVNVGDAKGAN